MFSISYFECIQNASIVLSTMSIFSLNLLQSQIFTIVGHCETTCSYLPYVTALKKMRVIEGLKNEAVVHYLCIICLRKCIIVSLVIIITTNARVKTYNTLS